MVVAFPVIGATEFVGSAGRGSWSWGVGRRRAGQARTWSTSGEEMQVRLGRLSRTGGRSQEDIFYIYLPPASLLT